MLIQTTGGRSRLVLVSGQRHGTFLFIHNKTILRLLAAPEQTSVDATEESNVGLQYARKSIRTVSRTVTCDGTAAALKSMIWISLSKQSYFNRE